MFDRVMTDCDGVGIVVSVDYHGARYDVQTPRLLCKHLPAERAHPAPGPMTLGYRLGRDAAPARRFVARAVDDGALQRLFDAWIGNGVLDRFLEDESLFGEFLRAPVSEGGVEPLVVGPPHVVVEVGA